MLEIIQCATFLMFVGQFITILVCEHRLARIQESVRRTEANVSRLQTFTQLGGSR